MSETGRIFRQDAMMQQWCANAIDNGALTGDIGQWWSLRENAEEDMEILKAADPPYDRYWIATRWVTPPEEERP